STYDGTVPLNVAYLVPAGTVRHQVMGRAERAAGPEERAAMTALVAQAVADGAVGLSTGLDYTPGLFADADEIAALCTPLARAGLPYVTHMRGGYEENSQVGVEEAADRGRAERAAGPEERAAMTALVAQAVADGAVGLSTGLDYTPGLFADADEIAALCTPLARAGLPYVTHMRGGYEENSQVGVEEA